MPEGPKLQPALIILSTYDAALPGHDSEVPVAGHGLWRPTSILPTCTASHPQLDKRRRTSSCSGGSCSGGSGGSGSPQGGVGVDGDGAATMVALIGSRIAHAERGVQAHGRDRINFFLSQSCSTGQVGRFLGKMSSLQKPFHGLVCNDV